MCSRNVFVMHLGFLNCWLCYKITAKNKTATTTEKERLPFKVAQAHFCLFLVAVDCFATKNSAAYDGIRLLSLNKLYLSVRIFS